MVATLRFVDRLASIVNSDLVTSGRILAREIRSQREPRPFVCFEVRGVRQRGNGSELTLIQAGQRSVDHVLSSHHPFDRKIANWHAGFIPQWGRGRARQYHLHSYTFFGELVL